MWSNIVVDSRRRGDVPPSNTSRLPTPTGCGKTGLPVATQLRMYHGAPSAINPGASHRRCFRGRITTIAPITASGTRNRTVYFVPSE
jgi:hypothetical protein